MWTRPEDQKPDIGTMGQSEWCFVCYKDGPLMRINIAIYDEDAKGSGWMEINTLKILPDVMLWDQITVPPIPIPSTC